MTTSLSPASQMMMLLMAAFLPAVLLLTAMLGPERTTSIALVIAAIQAVLVTPLVVAATRRAIDVFEPIYLLCLAYLLYFVVAPFLDAIVTNDTLFFGVDVGPLMLRGLSLMIAPLIAMLVGYYSPAGQFFAARLPTPRSNRESAVRYGWMVGFIAAAAFGTFLLTDRRSLLGLITLGQIGAGEIYEGDTSPLRNYLKTSVNLFIGASLILIAFQRRFRSVVALAFVTILVMNVALGFRYRVLILITAPVVLYYLRRHRRPGIARLALVATVFILTIGLVGSLRGTIRRGEPLSVVSPTQLLRSFSGSMAIYKPYLMVVDAFPARHDFVYGSSFAFVLYQPIPRLIWPEKPIPPIREIVGVAFQDQRIAEAGAFYPNVGEFYANYGVPGMIAGMFMFGMLARLLYEFLKRYRSDTWAAVLFSIALPYLVQVVSRGYFVQIFVETVFILGPVLFGMWTIGRLRHGAPSSSVTTTAIAT